MSIRPPEFDPDAAAAAAARFSATAASDIAYALVDTPVGTVVAARSARGLLTLGYEDHAGGTDRVLEWIAEKVSPRILEAPARLDDVRRELDEYFERRRTDFDLPIDWSLIGGFGRRVLRATARIPYGKTSTYAEVAAAAGSPRAYRAAGNALGHNPIPIIVPCHRVLAAGGRIGGYTGGLHRKEALLGVEGWTGARPRKR